MVLYHLGTRSQAIEDSYVLFKLLEKNNLNQKDLTNQRLRQVKE